MINITEEPDVKMRVQQSYMTEEESVIAIEKLFDPNIDTLIAKEQRTLFTNLQRVSL